MHSTSHTITNCGDLLLSGALNRVHCTEYEPIWNHTDHPESRNHHPELRLTRYGAGNLLRRVGLKRDDHLELRRINSK